jgi:FMN phosphatase YigB (HAD superfamily)/class 3 adenylate cyclase
MAKKKPPARAIAAVLFADIKGFSSLGDDEIDGLTMVLLPRMADAIRRYKPACVNTWGDAVFAVFAEPAAAAQCALDLRDEFRNLGTSRWPHTSHDLGIRIALHAATFSQFMNPITQRGDVIGRNVNLAARIEPIVSANEVWASHAYVTQLHAAGFRPGAFKTERIGELELVKGWGKEDLYRICRSYEMLAPVQRPIAMDRLIGRRGDPAVLNAMRRIVTNAKTPGGFLRVAGVANKDLFQPKEPNPLETAFKDLLSNSDSLQDVRVLFLNPDQVSRKVREAFETRPREVRVYTEHAIRLSLEAAADYRRFRNVHTRTAAEIPCFLFFNQEEMLCHPYLNSAVGPATEVILTVEGNRTYVDGASHFENLWADRWVLFDLGNVLVDFDHSLVSTKLWEHLSRTAAAGWSVPTSAVINDFFFGREPDGLSLNDELDLGRHSLEWLREKFCDKFGCSIESDIFRDCWNAIFGRTNPEAVECIQELQGMGINVGICSNTNEAHWGHVRRRYEEVVTAANEWFLSFQCGFRKPDEEFFNSIWRRTKVPVSHHLLIDDIEANVQGARSAGMEAEVFSGFHDVTNRVKKLVWDSVYSPDLIRAKRQHRESPRHDKANPV